MADVVAWDPDVLKSFRKKYGERGRPLPKTAMVRLLQKHGLRTLSYSAYLAWELSVKDGGSQPHAAHRTIIEETLREEGKLIDAARKAGRPLQV
jgi:hypothetical protein